MAQQAPQFMQGESALKGVAQLQKAIEQATAVLVELADVFDQELDTVVIRDQQVVTGHAVDAADMLLALEHELGLALLSLNLPGARRIERGHALDPVNHRHELAGGERFIDQYPVFGFEVVD